MKRTLPGASLVTFPSLGVELSYSSENGALALLELPWSQQAAAAFPTLSREKTKTVLVPCEYLLVAAPLQPP